MLEDLTNSDLIETVLEEPHTTDMEFELASRLQFAIDELERMAATIQRLEAISGANS